MKKSDISALNIAAPTLHMLVQVIAHERKHPSDPPQMRASLEALRALADSLHEIAAKHLTELANAEADAEAEAEAKWPSV